MAGWCLIADIFAIIGCCCISLFSCPPSLFPNVGLDGSSIVTSDCNANCNCEGITYNPVCSQVDGVTNFFSPCHAGCESFEEINGTVIYTNCACLQSSQISPPILSGTGNYGSVSSGICPVNCDTSFYALIGFLVVFSIISSTTRIPNFLLSLRSIELRDKSASISFSISFLSLFAFLPSPLVYGALLDQTCILWDTTKCGETTHCLIYDTDAMRNYLAFFPATFMALSFLADFGVFWYCKDLTIYDENENKNENKNENLEMNGFKDVDLNT